MTTSHADLACETCGRTTEHELTYAGRLLEGTRCTVCGTRLEISQRAMVPAYVRDLEQRLASKPRRMLRRWLHDPWGYARDLPRAIGRQPGKLLREIGNVLRR